MTNKVFHTEITFVSPFRQITSVDETLLDQMIDDLEPYSPAISVQEDRFTFSLSVEAADEVEALTRTISATNEAGRRLVKWELWSCARAEVVDWDEFERELQQPTFPELVGITEIAKMAGITRQRASQLARSQQFPIPHADLASGPIWLKSNIEHFVEQWDRKPGRPRKSTEKELSDAAKELRDFVRESAT